MDDSDELNFSQKSFTNLAPSTYDFIDFELMTGARTNSEILFTSTEHQMYTFNASSRLGKSYLCSYRLNGKRACKARVYLINENRCIKSKTAQPHSHSEDMLTLKRELVCLNEMKRRCVQLESFLSTSRLTVRDIFNQVLLE